MARKPRLDLVLAGMLLLVSALLLLVVARERHADGPVPSGVASAELPAAPAPDLAPVLEQLSVCAVRTEHLHHILETLIKVWPGGGREALPEPPPGWPAWPHVGMPPWRKDGW
jgi:hypothetical protein